MILSIQALKYTPTIVTMVGAEGHVLHQNSASLQVLGVRARHMQGTLDDGSELNYLNELFFGNEVNK